MDQWSVQHRVFAYDTFIKNGESVIKTQRIFRRHFNIARNDTVPSRNTLLRWVHKFRTTGTVSKKKPPGPARTVRTPDNIATVRTALMRSPGRSARRHAQELRIKRNSVRIILKSDLKFHPYKILVVQQLKERNYGQREDFAVRMQVLFTDNPDVMMLMSDEAHFHLNGSVNKQNLRYWAPENPCNFHEKPLHSPKVTVWCAVGHLGIIRPYFFLGKWSHSDSEFCTLCSHVGNISQATTSEARNKREKCLLPTRWGHSAYCRCIDASCEEDVPWQVDFTFW